MARLQFVPLQGNPAPYVEEPINDLAFFAWVAQAAPGETLVYHRGFLGIDIGPGMSRFGEPDRRRLLGLAQLCFHLAHHVHKGRGRLPRHLEHVV